MLRRGVRLQKLEAIRQLNGATVQRLQTLMQLLLVIGQLPAAIIQRLGDTEQKQLMKILLRGVWRLKQPGLPQLRGESIHKQ